jgi:ankyrin repeat protein
MRNFTQLIGVVAMIIVLGSCATSPKEQLSEMNVPYDRQTYIDSLVSGNKKIVRLFLEAGMSPNDRAQQSMYPLILAAKYNHPEIVDLLMDYEVDPFLEDDFELNALHHAAENGHLKIVKNLINRAKMDPNQHDNQFDVTPLMAASYAGHQSTVEFLIEKGADVNYSNKDGGTALHNAAYGGNVGVVTVLIDEGADVNAKLVNGITPLHFAAQRGNTGVVEVLLKADADTSIKSDDNKTAREIAVELEHEKIVKLLSGGE